MANEMEIKIIKSRTANNAPITEQTYRLEPIKMQLVEDVYFASPDFEEDEFGPDR